MSSATAHQNETQRRYLSTRQLSELTGISVPTLELWRRQGTGPAFLKLGKRVLYSLDDVESWLASHRCGGEVAQ